MRWRFKTNVLIGRPWSDLDTVSQHKTIKCYSLYTAYNITIILSDESFPLHQSSGLPYRFKLAHAAKCDTVRQSPIAVLQLSSYHTACSWSCTASSFFRFGFKISHRLGVFPSGPATNAEE
ncbi:hypothetical protein PAXRUDRAFT_294641 [Paxillus rubicundulus Ve08.2h10]|uniref:Uncharacterized protein n=1 Tax=Paxillus rubicundulus Ve08.2h10 TaxID=930991 RepID=A0A0D0DFS4_9AGAM|nr:hypothetical protein PAXRUDRAFT_294641 [Paxillus rubicundulus Ve08.2h10]